MKKEIRELSHDGILKEVASRYELAAEQIRFLKDAESYVYEFEKKGQPYILKITHTFRRTSDYIMGELEFLSYLADKGMRVSKAVPSAKGNLIEAIPAAQGQFLAIAYTKAPGHKVSGEEWNGQLFQTWGAYIGRMHALTKEYRLSNPAYKRQEWYEEDQLNLRKYVPADQTLVFEMADRLMKRIHQLPKDKESYGLVHTDLHQGNFFYDQGEITGFDFDDSGYNWFVNDIAIIVYFVQWFPAVAYKDKSAFVRLFFENFMIGYNRENQLDPPWFEYIPDFLRLRHVLLYGLFHQFMDLNNLDENEAKMLAQYRQDIENGTPIVDLDFTSILKQ